MYCTPQHSPSPSPALVGQEGDALLTARTAVLAAETAVKEFVESRINFERMPAEQYGLSDFKLERMRMLLSRLGNPQQTIPAVHIAGTKGKGSTAAMTAAILQAAGHRIGLFTSPHIEHFSERMTVDGQRPTAAELIRLLRELRPIVAAMDVLGDDMRPTFFEVITAMAWMHFSSSRVELVVLETGLGGRLDATNICSPRVCVITSISRDHERLLGSTLGAIAGEKAGILKPDVPVVSGVRADEPRAVIRRAAEASRSPLIEIGAQLHWEPAAVAPSVVQDDALRPPPIRVVTPWRTHDALQVPLPGEHQAHNLALAVASVDSLDALGIHVPPAAIGAGLQAVQWPLRIEVLRTRPLVIVDAAHNVASIEALLKTLAPLPAIERVLVFSTAKDKDTAGMLRRLAPSFDRIILTRFVQNPRSVPRSKMEALAREILAVPWTWADTPTQAWELASLSSSAGDLICATGSFFLAAEFRAVLKSP